VDAGGCCDCEEVENFELMLLIHEPRREVLPPSAFVLSELLRLSRGGRLELGFAGGVEGFSLPELGGAFGAWAVVAFAGVEGAVEETVDVG